MEADRVNFDRNVPRHHVGQNSRQMATHQKQEVLNREHISDMCVHMPMYVCMYIYVYLYTYESGGVTAYLLYVYIFVYVCMFIFSFFGVWYTMNFVVDR